MLEYRTKWPIGKWFQLQHIITLDRVRWRDYDHRIDGKVFTGDLTDEFVELFKKEMLWMRIKGYKK